MDDEQAPNRRMRESEKVPVAEGILCERHGISITDAVILLAAMTTARGTTATALASQIIDATVDPRSYPMPYGTSFVDSAHRAPRAGP
jgi:AmiR/NasT family two-component response regulator